MGTFTDIEVADLVDDVLALLFNTLQRGALLSSYINTETLTATKELTDADYTMQVITASGGSRTVELPPEATTNHPFLIYNASASNTVPIKDDSGTTTYKTLNADEFGYFVQVNGEGWKEIGITVSSLSKYFVKSGQMVNGVINVTVVSNDLVLAIKTLAGTDPSSTDPVYININGTVRTITAATSCTLADGTNWFNLGAAEFATVEQDLFAYAIWDSNSSAVAVAPARICHGRLVSDFSATTTNEKHLGNYANYTSTDDVCVIGRFAATLSAGAGYTWTVPTFTNANLIKEPVFETRELSWVPQFTNLTTTSGTLTAKYKIIGRNLSYNWAFIFGASSAISGSVSHTLPFTRSTFYGGSNAPTSGLVRLQDTGTATYTGVTQVGASSAVIVCQNAAGTYLVTAVLSSTVPFTWTTSDEILADDLLYFL